MKILDKIKNNFLIKNTIILIVTSLFIKMLSLVNRVIITRLLGNEGISLYVLILPTITLLSSFAGFSLNVTISKIVSEEEIKKTYSHKLILKEAIKVGLIATAFTITIFLFTLKIIANDLLKQPESFYPLLFSITIVPLVMFNNVLRGYYNGLNKIEISAKANLTEQISRLIFSTLLIYIFRDYNIVSLVSITVIAMAFGELISLFYSAKTLKKYLKTYKEENTTKKLTKEITSLSLSSTFSHLIINITFFLEPIIYTYALSLMNISSDETLYKYSEVNAYALPMLTMFMFTASAIATVIIPSIAKYKAQNEDGKIIDLTKFSMRLSLIPGIFLGIILFYFGKEYLNLLYNTSIGSGFIREYAILFSLFYIQPILIGVLQALGKQKKIFIFSCIESIVKITFLFILSIVPIITYKSLIYSIIISNILITLMLFIYLIKITKIKLSISYLLKFFFLFLLEYFTVYILKEILKNYIIISIISFGIYFIYLKLLDLIAFHNE